MNEKREQKTFEARFICFVGFFIAVGCCHIALKIEWFNTHSRHRFPLNSQSGKWRVPARDEKSVRKWAELDMKMKLIEEAEKKGQDFDFDKPLAPEQQAIIQKQVKDKVRQVDIESDFRDFVQSGGLVQTLLTPLLFILGLACLFHKGWGVKLLGGIYLVVACWAIHLMMSQGYLFGFTGD